MLLATFFLEREPMRWVDLPYTLAAWLQNAGALAAFSLLLVYLTRASRSFSRMFQGNGRPTPPGLVMAGTACTMLSWLGFLALGVLSIGVVLGVKDWTKHLPGQNPFGLTLGDYLFAGAGALALLVLVFPVLRSVFLEMRFARIWAVARLSIKEALRNNLLTAVFGVMALIFLFSQWFIPYKAENQVRNYVSLLYLSMSILFLLTAAILGSFSLPNDIKTLTIHTVVTKPITKFEVVLGRFLGNAVLLSVALFVIGLVSLGYVWRGVTDDARKESYTARVPIYGQLEFFGTKGDSVGREWDYRRYISGRTMAEQGRRQYALWRFPEVGEIEPQADGKVPIEFGFDIFRLTKGTENKGVFCTFLFADGKLAVPQVEALLEDRRRIKTKRLEEVRVKAAGAAVDYAVVNPQIDADLLKTHAIHEVAAVEISDYHTLTIDVPYSLIQRLREIQAEGPVDDAGRKPPVLQIMVSIDQDRGSQAQMLGVAPRDLYILAAEKSFEINFLKGLVGLWFSILLVLGIAISCSTYLSGVISLLCTLFLFMAGLFAPDIAQLAANQSYGGGPAESLRRIVTKTSIAAPLDDSPTTSVVKGVDEVFRWWLRRFQNVIPDASRYFLQNYVGNGFDISVSRVLLADNFVPLVGYLFPWFILAFYLINYREIANPM